VRYCSNAIRPAKKMVGRRKCHESLCGPVTHLADTAASRTEDADAALARLQHRLTHRPPR